MDPITIALVAGAFMQGYAQYKGSQAEAKAMEEQAAVQRLNAFEALRRAEENAKIVGKEGGKFKGEQIVAYAKAGVMIESGSSLLALEETNMAIAEQQKQIRLQAQYEAAAGIKQASLLQQQAKTTKQMGRLGFMSSVLGGATQAAGATRGSSSAAKTSSASSYTAPSSSSVWGGNSSSFKYN
jgi:DNA-binding protein H-NS